MVGRPLGYRKLVASDPEEQRLRDRWHAARELGSEVEKRRTDRELCDYIWSRAIAEREADRKKHPKAKRNLPVAPGGPSGGRALP